MSRLIDLDWFSVRAPVLVNANSSTLTALLIVSEAVCDCSLYCMNQPWPIKNLRMNGSA